MGGRGRFIRLNVLGGRWGKREGRLTLRGHGAGMEGAGYMEAKAPEDAIRCVHASVFVHRATRAVRCRWLVQSERRYRDRASE